MGWRTKTANARPVEHPSRGAAEAEIEDLRRRYHAGAKSLRVVRLYRPDDGVRVIDFEREDRDAAQALLAVERATAARDRAIRDATDQWEERVARAVALGQDLAAVAEPAGTTVREVRAILRAKLPEGLNGGREATCCEATVARHCCEATCPAPLDA